MASPLLWFAFTEFLLSLSPGPAVFLVVSKAIRGGFPAGMAATAGILGVNVMFFVLSVLGVGAAIAASPELFQALKYAGAAYLFWVGIQGIRDLLSNTPDEAAEGPMTAERARREWRNALPAGVLIQASSVKNLAIFVAIVPQFVDLSGDIAPQFMALCAVSVLVELPILAAYAGLASRVSRSIRSRSYRQFLDLAGSLALIAIAAAVLIA